MVIPLDITAGEDPSCWRCHAEKLGGQARRKLLHAPFRSTAGCVACHGAHPDAGTKAGLSAPQPQLCRRCHTGERFRRAHLHPIIEGDGCTACHEPHASDQPALLVSAADVLCATCHDAATVKQHGGLAPGGNACASCHDPHSSAAAKLLRPVVHEAMPDCSTCHAPAAGKPFARSDAEPALCLQCHDGIEKDSTARGRRRTAPRPKGPCTACHTPHASDRKRLLSDDRPRAVPALPRAAAPEARVEGRPPARPRRALRGVPRAPRRRPAEAARRRDAAALLPLPPGGAGLELGRSVHDPVRSGDCTSCHDAHGGGPRLLAKEGGALCAECHEVQAGEQKKGAGGHPPVAKGECRTCHVPHASEFDRLSPERPDALCARCHAAMFEARAGVRLHRPFEARRCTGVPRGARRACGPAPRRESVRELPRRRGEALGRRPARPTRRSPHGSCAGCHEPHGTADAKFLRKAPRELASAATRRSRSGSPPRARWSTRPPRASAMRCHAAHAAGQPKLLTAAVPALCLECHDPRRRLTRAHAPFGGAPSTVHELPRPARVGEAAPGRRTWSTRRSTTATARPATSRRRRARASSSPTSSRCAWSATTSSRALRARAGPARPVRRVPQPSRVAEAPPARRRGRGALRPVSRPRGAKWKKIHADAGAEGMDCFDCHDAHMKKK